MAAGRGRLGRESSHDEGALARSLRGARCLVTGGAGFIGSHLTERLVASGASVTVLDDFSTGASENLLGCRGPSLKVEKGDILDPVIVRRAIRGVKYVFHLAAQPSVATSVENPEGTRRINVEGTANVVEHAAIAGAKGFVLSSTCALYGNKGPYPQRETNPIAPLSPYAESKRDAEIQVAKGAGSGGLGATCLRFYNIYGPRQRPGQEGGVIATFLGLARRHDPLLINGSGRQTRDFVAVADAVDALARAAVFAPGGGEAINICTGKPVTINRLAEVVRTLFPGSPRPLHGTPRPGDVARSHGDPHLASMILGWSAGVPIEVGLRRLIRDQG